MKDLFCKRLAVWVCMKRAPDAASPERLCDYKRVCCNDDDVTASSPDTREPDATRQLLTRICHLLEVRVRTIEERRREDDEENEMKHDWMLAAAVLDRICGVVITVVFVLGTVMLFVAFAVHV